MFPPARSGCRWGLRGMDETIADAGCAADSSDCVATGFVVGAGASCGGGLRLFSLSCIDPLLKSRALIHLHIAAAHRARHCAGEFDTGKTHAGIVQDLLELVHIDRSKRFFVRQPHHHEIGDRREIRRIGIRPAANLFELYLSADNRGFAA